MAKKFPKDCCLLRASTVRGCLTLTVCVDKTVSEYLISSRNDGTFSIEDSDDQAVYNTLLELLDKSSITSGTEPLDSSSVPESSSSSKDQVLKQLQAAKAQIEQSISAIQTEDFATWQQNQKQLKAVLYPFIIACRMLTSLETAFHLYYNTPLYKVSLRMTGE
jgi:hypothetical protein